MKSRLSTKGQIVLPQALRQRLGLRPGDELRAQLDGTNIVLIPTRKRVRKARIIKDRITGLSVLTVGKGAVPLTSEQVRQILTEFP